MALFLFEKSGEMYLKYDTGENGKAHVHRDPINMNHLSNLPHRVLRYVERIGTELLINKKPQRGIFAKDPYIIARDKMSLACIPVKYLNVLTGIIYLKKNAEEGFNKNISSFVKGFIPSLLTKQTNIKEIKDMLTPRVESSDLTDREFEVLNLVAGGLSNSEISNKLYITLGTVRNHLSNIYAKLEVDNRIKAVIKAREMGIIKN